MKNRPISLFIYMLLMVLSYIKECYLLLLTLGLIITFVCWIIELTMDTPCQKDVDEDENNNDSGGLNLT